MDFRVYLQRELEARTRRNARYSLRSFARSLGIDASELSKVLRGRRPIGPRLVATLGERLGCSAREIAAFAPGAYRQIPIDTFSDVADWYHLAILERTSVKRFPTDCG